MIISKFVFKYFKRLSKSDYSADSEYFLIAQSGGSWNQVRGEYLLKIVGAFVGRRVEVK